MADWQQGMFGCFDNMGVCIFTFCCPCFVFGQIAEAQGENCLICGLCFLVEPIGFAAKVALRGRLREKRGIDGDLTSDILWSLLCLECTLCQERAEILAMQGAGIQQAQSMARE